MTIDIDDCRQLMTLADSLSIPYLAWTFRPRCPPNLLQDLTGGACGGGMPLAPTSWGTVVREHLLSDADDELRRLVRRYRP